MVTVGGRLTLSVDASPQAEHVSRRGTHWLFVSWLRFDWSCSNPVPVRLLHTCRILTVDGDGGE
jgi:hypothetical protein